MQIKKISLLNEFDLFLDSITQQLNSNQKLSSFAFEIPIVKISTLINSNLAINNDYFYWKIESDNLEFFAYDPLVNFNEFGEDRLSKTCDNVNQIETSFFSNWAEYNILNAPLVVGGIKFAPNQKSNLWEKFSDSDWFVPKVMFLKRNDAILLFTIFIILHRNTV